MSCQDGKTACEFDYAEIRLMSGVEGANANDNTNDNGKMATAMLGTLVAFDSQVQTWEEYFEVLEHFVWRMGSQTLKGSGQYC